VQLLAARLPAARLLAVQLLAVQPVRHERRVLGAHDLPTVSA
jgi:hypothetical protein